MSLEKLTEEQKALVQQIRDEWMAWGLCCKEADYPTAEQVITQFYAERAKLPAPVYIHAPSSVACQEAAAALLTHDKLMGWTKDNWPAMMGHNGGPAMERSPRAGALWRLAWTEACATEGANLPKGLTGEFEKYWGTSGTGLNEPDQVYLMNSTSKTLRLEKITPKEISALAKKILKTYKEERANDPFTQVAYWGQQESFWVAFYLFGEKIGVQYGADNVKLLHQWEKIASSICWWGPYEEVCIICDRPRAIRFDEQRRLHCLNAPAVEFSDGRGIFSVHGVRIPSSQEFIITDPDRITLKDIQGERNAEIRRVMLDQYGWARYLLDSKATLIDKDFDIAGDERSLWHLNIQDDEPLRMVQVINKSPEPDGTFRKYILRVPPTTESCHAAISWSFGIHPGHYHPEIET